MRKDNVWGIITITDEISLPNGLDTITEGLFSKCFGLKNVEISKSITVVGVRSFEECASLKSITIPDSVLEIYEEAFKNCASLTEVTISDNTSATWRVFYMCRQLKTINASRKWKKKNYMAADCLYKYKKRFW